MTFNHKIAAIYSDAAREAYAQFDAENAIEIEAITSAYKRLQNARFAFAHGAAQSAITKAKE